MWIVTIISDGEFVQHSGHIIKWKLPNHENIDNERPNTDQENAITKRGSIYQ